MLKLVPMLITAAAVATVTDVGGFDTTSSDAVSCTADIAGGREEQHP